MFMRKLLLLLLKATCRKISITRLLCLDVLVVSIALRLRVRFRLSVRACAALWLLHWFVSRISAWLTDDCTARR